MKTKLLTATILLCMLAICPDVFAQANRKRKMDTKEVYCTCGTKIKISECTYKDGEYMYYCPNLQCRSIWSIKIDFGKSGFDMPKIGEPVFKGRYKLPQDKSDKKAIHKCGESCINAFFDEKTNMIIIKRAGKCNETIYIAFPSLKKNYLLSKNEDEGAFYINIMFTSENKELLHNYTCTNDQSFFYKKYGDFPFMNDNK